MNVEIKRSNQRFAYLIPDHIPRHYFGCVTDVAEYHGFKKINSLDIDGWQNITWVGGEFNRLYVRDGELHTFIEWLGNYPYCGIVMEEIGIITSD